MDEWKRQSFTAGSMNSSLSSAVSLNDLPNLPGVRRDVSAINPKLYKEFKASRSAESLLQPLDEENSLLSYFDEGSRTDFNKILNPFPTNGVAYNDISGRYSIVSQQRDRNNKTRALPYLSTDSIPSFFKNQAHVCRFLAYFTEPATSVTEQRSRRVEIKLFLEDNSIEIIEPKIENSGTTQGKFLKRHQVLKPVEQITNEKPVPYTVDDFYAGAELVIYRRVYTLIDCDLSTRQYLDSIDRSFGTPITMPSDLYNPLTRSGASRSAGRSSSNNLTNLNNPKVNKSGFFEYDRKVLRFYGIWDSSSSLFGDVIKVKVHYTLADDMLEIIALPERNNGRDPMRTLLKKSLVMKKLPSAQQFHSRPMSPSTSYSPPKTAASQPDALTYNSSTSRILSEVQSSNQTPKPVMSTTMNATNRSSLPRSTVNSGISLPPGEVSNSPQRKQRVVVEKPYHWTDLFIGETVTVASLCVLLVDADEFTREFYQSKNVPLGPPMDLPPMILPNTAGTLIRPPTHSSSALSITGSLGGVEDGASVASMGTANDQQSVKSLLPPTVMKDGIKAKLYQGLVLRYGAAFSHPMEADKSREFIIQVHLEDDTFQIREPPIRNSGHKGGIFLARCKIDTTPGKYLQPSDVYLGAVVKILKHSFVIQNCDQYTFKYMEQSCNLWEYSDLQKVMNKIIVKKEALQRILITYPGLAMKEMDVNDLRDVLKRANCMNLVEQEIHTLFRAVDVLRVGTIKMTKMLKYIMEL